MAPTSGAPAPVLTNLPPSLPPIQLCFGHCAAKTPRWFRSPLSSGRGRTDGCAADVHHAVKREEITITLFFSELSGATRTNERTKVESDWKASLEQRGKKYRARCEAG